MFSLLHSRLLRPVFIALGVAMLLQVLLAVWLTRTTVDDLVSDLAARMQDDSQRLGAELAAAEREVGFNVARLPVPRRLGRDAVADLHHRIGGLAGGNQPHIGPTQPGHREAAASQKGRLEARLPRLLPPRK